MDRGYLENNKLFSKDKINNKTTIYWYKEPNDQFRVIVMLYNREVYNKVLDSKHYKIYHNYINERVKYLLDENILKKDYSMILLDNTMYTVIDRCAHYKTLLRVLVPVEGVYYYNIKDNLFDLVLDSTLRTGEVYNKYDLVYHNGVFYNDGNRIGSIRDFEREGIEYTEEDLLNGITYEQIMFLKPPYSRIKRYITERIDVYIEDMIRDDR